MRATTRTARAGAAIIIASVLPLTGGTGAASAEAGSTFLPFGQTLRRCDFSDIKYVRAGAYGRPTAQVRTEGADVVADIQFATGSPNTRYDVRVIQAPRPSALPCNAGDPGVAAAALFTDSAGAGALTVRGPLSAGATGVWVFITRPSVHSQVPEEFYTSDVIATL
ncbi:MAG: hypothetical protein U1D00_24020 [Mycobacterium sp.]|nr:hypothetical protein [Mycobacterium sp.]